MAPPIHSRQQTSGACHSCQTHRWRQCGRWGTRASADDNRDCRSIHCRSIHAPCNDDDVDCVTDRAAA